jgi:DNA-binding NtrC family response regulator
MYQRTVLVVEDEPLIRIMLTDALEDEGYAVAEAGTALEAVAILGQQQIDAVITDVDMPGGLSGLHLADFVHNSMQGIPVIVTSGARRINDCALAPGAKFIPKPYSLERMLDMLLISLAAAADSMASAARMRAS